MHVHSALMEMQPIYLWQPYTPLPLTSMVALAHLLWHGRASACKCAISSNAQMTRFQTATSLFLYVICNWYSPVAKCMNGLFLYSKYLQNLSARGTFRGAKLVCAPSLNTANITPNKVSIHTAGHAHGQS